VIPEVVTFDASVFYLPLLSSYNLALIPPCNPVPTCVSPVQLSFVGGLVPNVAFQYLATYPTDVLPITWTYSSGTPLRVVFNLS